MGVVEMTVGPTPYPRPKYPSVVIWDLPGMDTSTFQADRYLQRVLLDQFDFFIVISSESFTAAHAELACEILQRHKRFYFIRSEPTLEKKAASLRQRIWLVASMACGINLHPVMGIQDVVCNLYMLIRSLEGYRRSLGLDKDSLVKLAEQTD
ncbi:Interferon-Inducible Gtpase 5 [Manis pentadactyla]|nr:Interferon-Inducible Gtpase 5 [Manis pentadactyla]